MKIRLLKVLGIIGITLLVLSGGAFLYSCFLLSGIETFYRMMAMAIFFVIIVLLVFSIIDAIRFYYVKKFIVCFIISLFLTVIFAVGGYLIYSAYSKLDNFNKNELEYSTSLLTFNSELKEIEKLNNIKIGIVNDEENIEGYILPMELVDKYKLVNNNEIVEFSDNLTMMKALYDGEIDAVFISSNYGNLFVNIEGFEDLYDNAKVIEKYSKNYKKTEIEEEKPDTIVSLTEPITFLLLGVDSEVDGLAANASFNGDTIMMITFDPKTLNATLFSIPRDTYVTMACGGSLQKINHAAWGGSNCMVKTVEKLTGISIDYYVKINFKGVVDLVNAIGGIDVDVPVPDYPSEYCLEDSNRVSGNICLTAGYQTLDGEHALALARVRKAFSLGDFQRGQNQQLVVEGIIQKAKTVRSVSKFYEILDTVSKNIDTNMTTEQILSFYEVGKSMLFSNDNNMLNIQKTFLRGYSLYIYEPSSQNYTYSFHNWNGSLNDIVNAMKINLGLKEKEVIKTFSFSINEPYEKTVIGDRGYSESKRPLVPDFTTYTVSEAQAWGVRNGINVTVSYVNDSTSDGKIVSQSVHADTMLVRVSSDIIINVTKKSSSQTPDDDEEIDEHDNSLDNNEEIVVPGTPDTPQEPDDSEEFEVSTEDNN